jgi:lipoprotein signal peptidase
MQKKMRSVIVLTSMLGAMASWLIAYAVAPLGMDDTYFLCDAIAKVCVTFALFVFIAKELTWLKVTASVLLWGSISNLIDELFFDPTIFQINEGIFVVSTALFAAYYYAKRVRHTS